MKIAIIDDKRIDESFPGMNGGGYSATFMPSYGVQGSNDLYSYQIHAFNDSLQQKANKIEDFQYIGIGKTVSGVSYNNPNVEYTGKVQRVVKDAKGCPIALYIKTTDTNTNVSIRIDKNLKLYSVKPQEQPQEFKMTPSYNMSVNK